MSTIIIAISTAVIAGLLWVWRKWGKQRFDDPATVDIDESEAVDAAVEVIVRALVAVAIREAQKKGLPVDANAVAARVTARIPELTQDEALLRVNRVLSASGQPVS